MANKRKIAGTLTLGATVAGAVSSSAASALNPAEKVSEFIKSKYSSAKDVLSDASSKVKSFFTGKSAADLKMAENHEIQFSKEQAYGAAMNIAYRMYDVLKKSGSNNNNAKNVIDKLKEFCLGTYDSNKKMLDNVKINNGNNGISDISSYANTLLKLANEIGLEENEIKNCFTNLNSNENNKSSVNNNVNYKQLENVRTNFKSTISMADGGKVEISSGKIIYEFYVTLVGKTLNFSEKQEENSSQNTNNENISWLIRYISNTANNNEKAVLNALENLEKKIFNFDNDKDNTKAAKLIASLMIHKCENSKDNNSGKKLIVDLLNIKVDNNSETKFKDSEYAKGFASTTGKLPQQIETVYKNMHYENNKLAQTFLQNVSECATANQYADIFFKEETEGKFVKFLDNKVTRLAITAVGAAAGVALAPVVGLGILGTGVLAVSTASATNIGADLLNKDNRSWDSWSSSSIKNRYKETYKYMPMLAAVTTAKVLHGIYGLFK